MKLRDLLDSDQLDEAGKTEREVVADLIKRDARVGIIYKTLATTKREYLDNTIEWDNDRVDAINKDRKSRGLSSYQPEDSLYSDKAKIDRLNKYRKSRGLPAMPPHSGMF
jgi:hypothetical protein